jgi:hypothetical protein
MVVCKYRSLDVSQCGIHRTCGTAVLKELNHFRAAHKEQRNFLDQTREGYKGEVVISPARGTEQSHTVSDFSHSKDNHY